jgi:hypothetical protein
LLVKVIGLVLVALRWEEALHGLAHSHDLTLEGDDQSDFDDAHAHDLADEDDAHSDFDSVHACNLAKRCHWLRPWSSPCFCSVMMMGKSSSGVLDRQGRE